jgi:hypothetical protein
VPQGLQRDLFGSGGLPFPEGFVIRFVAVAMLKAEMKPSWKAEYLVEKEFASINTIRWHRPAA